MLKKFFSELGLSETARTIYLMLLENGSTSARLLAENLGIPRASVYDNLNILIQKGLVLEYKEGSKKLFHVDDVKNLPNLLTERVESLEKEKAEITSLLPQLVKQTNSIEPRVRLFSGIEGVRQVLNDILWYENAKTLSMWPISEMAALLGKDYFERHNRRRIAKNISIRGIWPQDRKVSFKDYPFLGTGKGHLRELRVGPKGISSDMGYWIYDDKVALLSSRKETFGLIIHSKDFADMMRGQFETLWKASKPIQSKPEETRAFLNSLRSD